MAHEGIKRALADYLGNESDVRANMEIGYAYFLEGQKAAAVSHFLKAAEIGFETEFDLTYNALLLNGIIFESMGDRRASAYNAYLQAQAYQAHRPEAHFLVTRWLERSAKWQECNAMAHIGRLFTDQELAPLPFPVEYPGEWGFLFEIAVSDYWIGRKVESILGFQNLLDHYPLDDLHRQSCYDNVVRLSSEAIKA